MIERLLLVLLLLGTETLCWGSEGKHETLDLEEPKRRAAELKTYLTKEKASYSRREIQRHDTLDELDRLNSEQNSTRLRIGALSSAEQELQMSAENLQLEVEKLRRQEQLQRRRLQALLKILYKIRREGILRFVVNGADLSQLAGRVRVLYRTLRSHTLITHEMAERTERLKAAEKKLAAARTEFDQLLGDMKEQQEMLTRLLAAKSHLLKRILKKQDRYQGTLREYARISTQLKTLFADLESSRDSVDEEPSASARRGTLPLPVENGQIIRGFGKSVHEKFKTVTYFKGVEISAPLDTPVTAVLRGAVEFDGWLKGLGNVVILHHGNGFYSLHAHLNKVLSRRGTQVAQGETIGSVGDTGSSENPSLYFELREDGKAVDPLLYFASQALAKLN